MDVAPALPYRGSAYLPSVFFSEVGSKLHFIFMLTCAIPVWRHHRLAPSTYIFFASVIPALTFGEQIADETNNEFGGAQILAATAICGVIQSVFGGQPMLIVGVAEPIVLMLVFFKKGFMESSTMNILKYDTNTSHV